ncbi:MAG: glycosyltransferase [Bacteroidia bacterium]
MNIGIFTYGSRGDVQPFIALAITLKQRGHTILLGAPANFQQTIQDCEIDYHKIDGDLEKLMYEPEIQNLLETGNTIAFIKGLQKNADKNSKQVAEDLMNGCNKVDFIITTFIPLFYVASIAEKLNKPFVNIILNPPTTPTKEFPYPEFDFLNFPAYNYFTYKVLNFFIWQAYKKRINTYRNEIGLPNCGKSLQKIMEENAVPTIYALSESLITKPKDWALNYKITGFLYLSQEVNKTEGILETWLNKGEKPIYIGFGSIPIPKKLLKIIPEILASTSERIILCKGWSTIDGLPENKNLFIIDKVDHQWLFPKCKVAIFHGGAGTLAAVIKSKLPVIIISIFVDQPIWGKIIEYKKLGIHIPAKKITTEKLISAIQKSQTDEIKNNVSSIGQAIKNENGLDNAIQEIEKYFNDKQKYV